MNRNIVRQNRQQQKHRQRKLVVKCIFLFFILNLVLPFYGGATTSALANLSLAYYPGNSGESEYEADDPGLTPSPSPIPIITPEPTQAPVITPFPTMEPTPVPTITPTATIPPDPILAGEMLQELLRQAYVHEDDKVAYLTFDDGPTKNITRAVLDVLAEKDVKATFFVIGTSIEYFPDLLKQVYEEGHGIGNHTYSHVFKKIYASPQSFVDSLQQNEALIQSVLETDNPFRLVRFPGGSFGNSLEPFREAVNQAGFGYVDWNSLNGDSESLKGRNPEQLLERLKETVYGQSGLVVLMHDAPNKQTTPEALPAIIDYLRSEGYRFELLPGSR